MTEHLLVEAQDEILIVTLNRPEKLNALTQAMMDRFEAALLRFRDTPALKVMLIRANGRYFSAGVDLKEVMATQEPMPTGSAVRETHRVKNLNMHRIYDEMEHIEKPIVVAHHAPCVGGGLEMSLSCDFRLAAKSAHQRTQLRGCRMQPQKRAAIRQLYCHGRCPLQRLPLPLPPLLELILATPACLLHLMRGAIKGDEGRNLVGNRRSSVAAAPPHEGRNHVAIR
jgi:hypothetical protein